MKEAMMKKLNQNKGVQVDHRGMEVGVVAMNPGARYKTYLWTYMEDIDTVMNRQPSIRLYNVEEDRFEHFVVNSIGRMIEIKDKTVKESSKVKAV
ncbi:hypothetical protein ACQUY5_32245, partial [Bacillus cereus]|uniref:hypothetical protein n=1 Tax=Bacillus cereus TaxID=1396 RepID=UPI003D16C51E